jgi:hypothetical protein
MAAEWETAKGAPQSDDDEPEPQVRRALARLSSEVENIAMNAQRLIAKIDPVLRPLGPETSPQGPAALEDIQAEIAGVISGVRRRLEEVDVMLADAYHRVEV